jgi:hypothetical protein
MWRPANVALLIAAMGIVFGLMLDGAFPGRDLAGVVLSGSLGLIAILFAAELLRSLEGGSLPSIERDWGGLAGDEAGWRMSLPLVYLLGTCLFGILTVASFILLAPRPGDRGTGSPPVPVVAPRPGDRGTGSPPVPVVTPPPAPSSDASFPIYD